MRTTRALGSLALIVLPCHATVLAQSSRPDTSALSATVEVVSRHVRALVAKADSEARQPSFHSRADSLDWEHARALAEHARELRLVISLFDRKLWLLVNSDTMMTAPAAVASGVTLDYAGRSWTFRTPRGRHPVIRKTADPVWTPPDWAYAEVAAEHELKLAHLAPGKDVSLTNGSRLTVRDSLVGLILAGTHDFAVLPTDEHIVFDETLFIPPHGTVNRRVSGELGRFALDLGDGYMIHGTPHESSIGHAITHGCIRLRDEDIAWLYEIIPDGTPVYIY